jgi:hypothetical protein
VARFQHSAWLRAKGAQGGKGKEDRGKKGGPTERSLETLSPPGDESAFVTAPADDIGGEKRQDDERYAAELATKAWCTHYLGECGVQGLGEISDAVGEGQATRTLRAWSNGGS